MSVRAVQYVKEMDRCEDGEPLSMGQKLLLMVLADYHNPNTRLAWPGVLLLAQQSKCSKSQAQRHLNYLEKHGVLRRLRPDCQGRGQFTQYMFLALDGETEGGQNVPLCSAAKRVAEGSHTEPKRVAEGSHTERRYKEERKNQEQPENRASERAAKPSPICAKYLEAHPGIEVMKALLTLLSQRIDPHKFEIWIARCQFAGVEGGALVLSVPNRDFVSICERLQEEIMAAIKELAMPFSGVRFESRGCGGEE